MFVWIPRYSYSITSGYHTSTAGTIDIKFLKGISNEALDGTTIHRAGYSAKGTNTSNAYFLHPAFQDGSSTGYQNGEWDNELTGIWIAKFEASHSDATSGLIGSSSTVTVKPNVKSWVKIATGDVYTTCLNILPSSNSHMMKNSEWGAIAYLTQSKYGRNGTEITINNNSSNITGGGNYASNTVQSTTGNIYGIYDISGGLWERMASYITNGNMALSTYGSSYAYTTTAEENPITRSTKYATAYAYNASSQSNATNYAKNIEKYGDAVYETSFIGSGMVAWFTDYSYFSGAGTPFFSRGGGRSNGAYAGAFAFCDDAGDATTGIGFRPVLAF